MNTPKFSIIIPVYNVENYLRKCLDSIVAQTLKDFEVICINDGSTDGSLAILSEYANRDSRFKVISQTNQGQGIARKSQILNCGLPRNDILFQNNQELKIKLKQKMCIPEHKKIILYCPTWRRYDKKANLPFNLDNMREKLSDNYIIILRSHVGKHSWVDSDNNPINIFDNKFCFDGSCVQEVTDLYLISDLMISDYSSAIFDFAITQKPQIFYAYDLESYENQFGFYEKYEEFCPGPIVTTQGELISNIKNINSVYQTYKEKYKRFKETYLAYEKGNATKTLVDLILKGGNCDR